MNLGIAITLRRCKIAFSKPGSRSIHLRGSQWRQSVCCWEDVRRTISISRIDDGTPYVLAKGSLSKARHHCKACEGQRYGGELHG